MNLSESERTKMIDFIASKKTGGNKNWLLRKSDAQIFAIFKSTQNTLPKRVEKVKEVESKKKEIFQKRFVYDFEKAREIDAISNYRDICVLFDIDDTLTDEEKIAAYGADAESVHKL